MITKEDREEWVGVGRDTLQTMVHFWKKGRRKIKQEDPRSCSTPRKSWPTQLGALEQRLAIKGVLHWAEIVRPYSPYWTQSLVVAAWESVGRVRTQTLILKALLLEAPINWLPPEGRVSGTPHSCHPSPVCGSALAHRDILHYCN